MAAVDVAGPSGGKKKKGGGPVRPKRRVAIRIDMTPMVDVAFLLLIFFMVTTVFRQPQALEISLPPKDAKVEVAQSNVLTLRVLSGPRIYAAVGTEPYHKVADPKTLGKQVADIVKANPKLVVLIKIARDVKYETMVDIIDNLEIHDMSRFGLAPLEEKEKAEVEGIQ
jgi:biopolymer transport protein ExbD